MVMARDFRFYSLQAGDLLGVLLGSLVLMLGRRPPRSGERTTTGRRSMCSVQELVAHHEPTMLQLYSHVRPEAGRVGRHRPVAGGEGSQIDGRTPRMGTDLRQLRDAGVT